MTASCEQIPYLQSLQKHVEELVHVLLSPGIERAVIVALRYSGNNARTAQHVSRDDADASIWSKDQYVTQSH